MTEPDNARSDGVDLGKQQPPEEPFDPYRFGKPEHPIPAEYAPPGYTGPTVPSGPRSYPGATDNPFGNPPGTPYSPYGPPPPGYPPSGPPPSWPPTPPGYGAPPPPPYSHYSQPKPGNGKAIAALVLGILAVVLFWLSVLDAFLIIPAIVFGVLGLTESRRTGNGRGLALAGLICAAVATVAATVFTVFVVHAANECGGLHNNNTPGFQQCVRDHL